MTKLSSYMTTLRKPSRRVQHWEVAYLNEVFTPMTFEERIRHLYRYFPEHEVMMTSSFGTKSAFMLYWISKLRPSQRIYFLDTTYHFRETLEYKAELSRHLGLQVEVIRPDPVENQRSRHEKWWQEQTTQCCYVNKVQPLEPVKAAHQVWISGLMGYQTDFRSDLQVFEQQGSILKFHPIVDIDEGEFLYYMDLLQLPRHPLEAKGYGSIGCTHCTVAGAGRSGRWQQSEKTECGLHPDFFLNKKK